MGKDSLQRILVIQTAFLGDVILATSVIEKLHQHYPETKIDFLLRKGNEKILVNHPFLNEVLIFNKESGKYINLFKIIKEIRLRRYDLVINIQRFATTGLITLFSGAAITVGFDKNPFSFFFTKKISHSFNGPNEAQRNHDLIRWMTDDDWAMPKLFPTSANYDKIEVLRNVPYLCLAPGSVWFTKQFPFEKWVELIKTIPENLLLYIVGSKQDHLFAEKIMQSCEEKNIRNLCRDLDILDTAALMKYAVLNIVNDSAHMHIASGMNAPVCTIYCSTSPKFGYRPLSDKSYIIETEVDLKCRPCGKHGKKSCPEKHFRCAYEIDIQKILKVINQEMGV
jgi:heptosyltransferase II